MREDTGNLWTYPADAIVITTNGTIKKNGEAVLGRGCAKEASELFPHLAFLLGNSLKVSGNKSFHYYLKGIHLLTMPVKHNWWEKADIGLIEKSAYELISHVDGWDFNTVIMPRAGAGNGKLDWAAEVKPILDKILGDKFIAITYN